jgi:hypothetical protein
MFRLVTRRITLSISFLFFIKSIRGRLTETTRPPISPKRISLIKSSTPIAPGKSFLFANTSKGTDCRDGKPRRACNSDVAVGSDLVCQVSLGSHFQQMQDLTSAASTTNLFVSLYTILENKEHTV